MADHSPRERDFSVAGIDRRVSTFWRWGQMLLTLFTAIFIAGIVWNRATSMEASLAGMQHDIAELRMNSATTVTQLALVNQDLATKTREIEELKSANREMRGLIDTMRNMREAYVYNSARRQPSPPSVSP